MGRTRLGQIGFLLLPLLVGVGVLVAFQMAGLLDVTDRSGGDGTPDDRGTATAGIIISEFAASNGTILADADGDHPDWLELYNPTEQPVALLGMFLSDDDADPDRWALPETTLDAGGHLLVWTSGKDRSDPGVELHTDFAIDADGEPLLLAADGGATIVDRVDPIAVPRDASYGRDPTDLERWCFFASPTPGTANSATCFEDASLGAPLFSVGSGFYDLPVALEISAGHPDATIVYTLDGSYPDLDDNAERTRIYEGPLWIHDRSDEPNTIATVDGMLPEGAVAGGPPAPRPLFDGPIQKATVVRARTIDGAETAATYFIGPELVRSELPVLSLGLDEGFLFDQETGIYVAGRTFQDHVSAGGADLGSQTPANYNQRGRAWERPPEDQPWRAVVVERCSPGGPCDYQGRAGIRIHGGASRAFQQKSLRLYARTDYGSPTFDYPFFGADAPGDHSVLILRNSGQGQRVTLFLDSYLQDLMAGSEADTQASEPMVVFINGSYWGIYHLRERYDEEYLRATYGVDPDTVQLANGGPSVVDDGALVELIATGNPADDAWAAQVEAMISPESFFDFLVANLYAVNTDWPGNNVRLWRDPEAPDAVGEGPRDGRWRWMIMDLDALNGISATWGAEGVEHDLLASGALRPTADPEYQGGLPLMFRQMMDNPGFRDRFLTRFADHLNTRLRPEHALAALERHVQLLEPEIGRHFERFGTSTVETWLTNVADLRSYLRDRPAAQRQQLVDDFGLAGTATLGVRTDRTRGRVQVNTVTLDAATPGVADPGDWQGVYFQGVPVRLVAIPYGGQRFVRWEGLAGELATTPVVEVVLDADVAITAVFEPS